MSEFIKTQQEVRANLFEQIKEVIDSAEADKRGLDAAELEKIDRIEADIRRADEAISIAQRNEERKVEASVAAKGFVPAVQAQDDDAAILRSIANGEVRGHTFEKRQMVPNANLVGTSFFDEVLQVARLVGPMLDVSRRIDTGTGETLTIPLLTGYSTATIKAAGSAIDNSEPTFSNIQLGAFKYSLLIPVANELLNDSTINLTSLLAEQAGNGIGFAVNDGLTNGTGTVQPFGVVNRAGSGITGGTGVGGGFTADNLIDLQYSLDGAARRLPGVAYMTSTAGLGRMRKLKDDDGAYLYQVNVGAPDTFAGYDVVENPAIPAVGTGVAGSVLFGHWPSYIARTAGGIQVATSTDYAFNQDVTTFRVTLRVDGNLTHPGHIKYFKGGAS
jgi:HK97 family phage major capsid protein